MGHHKRQSQDNFLAAGPPASGFQVCGRIWVEKDGQTFLSWGRVVLLERIQEHGSVSAAARSMGMGYRHAWSLVEEMNRLAEKALVDKQTGGLGGGGARLTEAGKTAVAEFWDLGRDLQGWMQGRKLTLGGR